MKNRQRISKRNLNLYSNFMDNQNSTADIEIVCPDPIEELDLSKHYNSQELAKKINEIIRKSK